MHSGTLPNGAGYHHYPKPIVDIDHFRRDDFQLFVEDPDGHPAAVVPVAPRGSGDARVRLLAVHPGSSYGHRLLQRGAARTAAVEDPAVLPVGDPRAVQAFRRQS